MFLILSAGPTLIWLIICLRLDKDAPEPKNQVVKTFFFGVVITIPIILIAGYLTDLIKGIPYFSDIAIIFILSFLIDGLIEEFAKYIILFKWVYKSLHFNELRDGFIYGMIIGLGLAFVENILYGIASSNIGTGVITVLLRGFITTLLHFLTGGIIGYYIALVKFHSKPHSTALYGLGIAVLLHGLYNTIVRFGWWWNIFPLLIILLLTYIIILIRIRKMKTHL